MVIQRGLYWFKLAGQPSYVRRLGIALVVLALMPFARSQSVNTRSTQSSYKSLDRQAAEAKDAAAIRALFLEIHARTLSAPMPPSVLNRLVAAQEAFLSGTHASVTEAAVADAVNAMGREVDPATYTGTNAMQVRLLRIQYLPRLESLLTSPSPRPANKIVANDLSPAGAVYLGLLLLRQKLANPAWFGDPDTQNKLWLASRPTQPITGTKTTVRVADESPEETNFRLVMQRGLASEGSATTRAYHHFLDCLGVKK